MSARRAFTLLELVLSLAVVAVLLALVVPAVGAARRSAIATKCLTTLAGIGRAQTAVAAERRDAWPSMFVRARGAHADIVADDTTVWGVGWWSQTRLWLPPIATALGGQDHRAISAQAVSCPAAYAAQRWSGSEGCTLFDKTPLRAAATSYYQSAALFSAHVMWADGFARSSKAAMNRAARLARTTDATFPSLKVSMAETTSYHDSNRSADAPNPGRLVCFFMDVHGELRAPDARFKGLPYARDLFDFPQTSQVPFSAAANGLAGRDF